MPDFSGRGNPPKKNKFLNIIKHHSARHARANIHKSEAIQTKYSKPTLTPLLVKKAQGTLCAALGAYASFDCGSGTGVSPSGTSESCVAGLGHAGANCNVGDFHGATEDCWQGGGPSEFVGCQFGYKAPGLGCGIGELPT